MKTHVTNEMIEKLPKWAQEHINDIKRQREVAVRELNEWTDSQSPAPFYVDEMVCTGERQGPSTKRRYIQSNKMCVVHAGIFMEVTLRDDCMSVAFSDEERAMKHICITPVSFNRFEVRDTKNAR